VVVAQIRANTCALNHTEKRGMVFRARRRTRIAVEISNQRALCRRGPGSEHLGRDDSRRDGRCAGMARRYPAASLLKLSKRFPCQRTGRTSAMGQPRQNISLESMSAPDQIAANCCAARFGIPGQLQKRRPASDAREIDVDFCLRAANGTCRSPAN
jgi:hypothetical protein